MSAKRHARNRRTRLTTNFPKHIFFFKKKREEEERKKGQKKSSICFAFVYGLKCPKYNRDVQTGQEWPAASYGRVNKKKKMKEEKGGGKQQWFGNSWYTILAQSESFERVILGEKVFFHLTFSFVVVVVPRPRVSTVVPALTINFSVSTATVSSPNIFGAPPPPNAPSVVVSNSQSRRLLILRTSQGTDKGFHPDGSYRIKEITMSQ